MHNQTVRSYVRFFLRLVIVPLFVGVAAAQSGPYLALGDSIPFGFNPDVRIGDIADYHGYPQYVASALGLTLANASCPGETSGSFLNFAGAPLTNLCHEYRTGGGPLFVPYGPNESQLAFAVAFLRANPNTRLVTITIGGDDLLQLEAACATQTDPSVCELEGLGTVLADYGRNLTEIYLAIRLKGHYFGPIVAANYFSPNYANPLDDIAIGSLNAVMLGVTGAFGGKVADVFSAFQAASVPGGGLPCAPAVGLAFVNLAPPGGCDVHPTVPGQELIANLVVNALK